jgi:ClpP class serine protease
MILNFFETFAMQPARLQNLAIQLQAKGQRPTVAAGFWEDAVSRFNASLAPKELQMGIAAVTVSGVMCKGCDVIDEMWWGAYNYDRIHKFEEQLPRGTSTLIVRLDTPGGSVCGLFEAVESLRALSLKTGIHTIAYTDTLCCSAGYALASVCAEVTASPSAFVGSVGCIMSFRETTGYWQSAGFVPHTLVSEGHEKKAILAPGREFTAEDEALLQAETDQWGAKFQALVESSRPKVSVISGESWPASEAPEGYVDATTDAKGRSLSTVDHLVRFLTGAK